MLLCANVFLWSVPTPQGLIITFFDVGQGDSILIEGPTGVQVLVDAGPDSSALRALGSRMTFFDRTLDALVLTHPDQDHIGGAADILDRYDVQNVLEPSVANDTRAWVTTVEAVEAEVQSGARHVVARAGQRLELGGGAYADILFPNRDVTNVKDTNSGSVVMRIVYGDTAFVLTGDAPTAVEQELFLAHGYGLNSDVLKAGHHGSKTSSSADFVQSVSPSYVIYSRGCDNRYGHPAPTVVSFFESLHVTALDTCESGDISFISDGQTIDVRP